MNQSSPGNELLEGGIELVGIHQESALVHGGRTTALDHDYEEEQLDGNDTQALLNGSVHVPRGLGPNKGTFAVIWPRIKGIVIEVLATLANLEKFQC